MPLRWQLQRIEQDQADSPADPGDGTTASSLHAGAWEFLARNRVGARWTLDEHQRLITSCWRPAQAKTVANIVFDLRHGGVVSGEQVAADEKSSAATAAHVPEMPTGGRRRSSRR
jgi:hypothetical protein